MLIFKSNLNHQKSNSYIINLYLTMIYVSDPAITLKGGHTIIYLSLFGLHILLLYYCCKTKQNKKETNKNRDLFSIINIINISPHHYLFTYICLHLHKKNNKNNVRNSLIAREICNKEWLGLTVFTCRMWVFGTKQTSTWWIPINKEDIFLLLMSCCDFWRW